MKKKILQIIFIILGIFAIVGSVTLSCLASSPKYYFQEVDRFKTNKKILMLTFDDGPEASSDNDILNVLKDEDVPGVFFETGINIENAYKEKANGDPARLNVMKRIINEGSWIGSHTYHHDKYLDKTNYLIKDVKESFDQIQGFYKNEMNMDLNLNQIPLRFSYLQYYKGMDDIRTKLGISHIIGGYLGTDYEIPSGFTPGESIDKYKKGIDKILKQYESHLAKGQILVGHTRAWTKDWLRILIPYCKSKGYTFVGMNPKNEKTYYRNFGRL